MIPKANKKNLQAQMIHLNGFPGTGKIQTE